MPATATQRCFGCVFFCEGEFENTAAATQLPAFSACEVL